MSRIHRLFGVALASGVLALSAVPALAAPPPSATPPAGATGPSVDSSGPRPKTPIEHLVVLMQTGHSFDNYFGTYPGADGIPAGVCQRPSVNQLTDKGCVRPFRLAGRPPEVLDHGRTTWRRQYNTGKMNGFLAASRKQGRDGTTAMGYYDGDDLGFYWNAAARNVLFDRFFSSARSSSRLNHFYWVTGGPTPQGSEVVPKGGYTAPTIFDRLQAAGVSWKFYVESYDPKVTFRTTAAGKRQGQLTSVPLLNYARFLDDPALAGHVVDARQYNRDLEAGTLPSVAYVVTAGSSEAPPGSPRAGQRFVQRMATALAKSPYWSSSAFLWTYDGWGGWYDHAPPPQVDQYGYGFRVPAVLVSAYARRGQVDHTPLDYTSVLKFVEENWGVAPLSERDAKANSLSGAFDFSAGARPAELVSSERAAAVVSVPSHVVYLFYGAAVVVAVSAFLLAAVRRRRPFADGEAAT
jgi:phospholipase C